MNIRHFVNDDGVYLKVKPMALFRVSLMVAVTSMLLMATQEKQKADCCDSSTVRLPPSGVKGLLQKIEPIRPPCCAHVLNVQGIAVLEIALDSKGNVTCGRVVSGHPIMISSILDSVSRWKFRPYISRGRPSSFCGRIGLRYQANERMVKYDVIEAPQE
jgi:outer membrane biosynthesis protein TonB